MSGVCFRSSHKDNTFHSWRCTTTVQLCTITPASNQAFRCTIQNIRAVTKDYQFFMYSTRNRYSLWSWEQESQDDVFIEVYCASSSSCLYPFFASVQTSQRDTEEPRRQGCRKKAVSFVILLVVEPLFGAECERKKICFLVPFNWH